MAYVGPHYVASFLYGIVNTDEVAVTSLRIGPGNTDTPSTPTQAMATALDGVWEDFISSVGFGWADYSRYLGVKLALVDATGHYTTEPVLYTRPTPLAGQDSGASPQNSIVISLRSGTTLGKGNYGRLYLPHSGRCLPNQPYMAGTRTEIATAAGNMVGAVNDVFAGQGAGTLVRIYSEAVGTGGTRTARPVTQVAVGRVIDTQRRRRNALTEDYVFATVAG